MKAILINVTDETIKEVEIDDNNVLHDWYEKMGVQMVEVAHYFDDRDSILVDEEGLYTLNEHSKFFSVEGGHDPFIGNGLVVGVDPMTGESVDCRISVEKVRDMVKFHTLWEVRSMV